MKWALLFFVSLLLISCGVFCKDEKLRLTKTTYSGSELKLNGFYYAPYDNGDSYAVLVFYSNGVFVSRAKTGITLQQIESDVVSGQFDLEQKGLKSGWGLFQSSGTGLITESWKPRPCGSKAIQLVGTILNDSTLQIGNLQLKDNLVLDYTFKPFPVKPDSTNNYL